MMIVDTWQLVFTLIVTSIASLAVGYAIAKNQEAKDYRERLKRVKMDIYKRRLKEKLDLKA